MRKHPHFVTTEELSYFIARGIGCRRNSRQLSAYLRALSECEAPLKNLGLAARLAGYAVVPQRNGENFTFCRMNPWCSRKQPNPQGRYMRPFFFPKSKTNKEPR